MPSEGVPARLGVDARDGRWSEGWNRLVSCDIGILKVSRAEGASANGKTVTSEWANHRPARERGIAASTVVVVGHYNTPPLQKNKVDAVGDVPQVKAGAG